VDLAFVDKVLAERHIQIDAIYSSALERARQTARYFARSRGIHLIRDTRELNEINYGNLFGKSKSWVAENIPQYKTDPDFVYPGGESFRQMQRRAVGFLLSIEPRHRMDTVLCVVHAGVVRGVVCHFLGLDFASNLKRKVSHRYIAELQIDEGLCRGYNEMGSLSGFVVDGAVALPQALVLGGGEPSYSPT
jgi:broad specificity phosphatase PhoE